MDSSFGNRQFAFALAAALFLLAGTPAAAQGLPNTPCERPGASYWCPGYSGGGIRGVADVVADGQLITPEEARELGGGAQPQFTQPRNTRQVPVIPPGKPPRIRVLEPAPQGRVTTVGDVLTLSVEFREGDAPIVPESFRIGYGSERAWIDITKRVQAMSTVSTVGLTLHGVKLPPGLHRFRMEVMDQAGRLATHETAFKVE